MIVILTSQLRIFGGGLKEHMSVAWTPRWHNYEFKVKPKEWQRRIPLVSRFSDNFLPYGVWGSMNFVLTVKPINKSIKAEPASCRWFVRNLDLRDNSPGGTLNLPDTKKTIL